jgi:hypothetical protein
VQKGGGPQFREGRRVHQGRKTVPPNVVAVVDVPLVKVDHRQNLRPEDPDNLRMVFQNPARVFAAEQLCQFNLYPFRRNVPQKPRVPVHGAVRRVFLIQPQDGGETHSPENPQSVLLKTPVRVPHAPQNPVRQILPPAEGVPEFPLYIEGHGVYCKVSPGQVLLQRTGEGHRFRPPVVSVNAVHPVGRDLH